MPYYVDIINIDSKITQTIDYLHRLIFTCAVFRSGCPSALQGLKLILKEHSNALTFSRDFYGTFMALKLKKSLVKTHEHENIDDGLNPWYIK